jgi:hypothetical protein
VYENTKQKKRPIIITAMAERERVENKASDSGLQNLQTHPKKHTPLRKRFRTFFGFR